jgi:hypothetical protein
VDIGLDSAGNAYVAGITSSADFPTANPLQPALAGSADAFVVKIDPNGSTLLYSTYLGGSYSDEPAFLGEVTQGIAVDGTGSAYLTGQTLSIDFPTVNPMQPALAGESDAFVAKLNPTGSALAYATYLGGNGGEQSYDGDISVDTNGNVYVTGDTSSDDFPTLDPLQPTMAGYVDAFVAKLNPEGALVFSTYLGGFSLDVGRGISVDVAGNLYLTGSTYSDTDFPIVASALQPTMGSPIAEDAFIAKLDPSGAILLYSSYLGGSDQDHGRAVAVDVGGNAYVVGDTDSDDFPLLNPLQPVFGSVRDAFVVSLDFGPPIGPGPIVPDRGGDTGPVTVLVQGDGFVPGVTVKLVRAGQPEIPGEAVNLAADGLSLMTTFDLTGQARGTWDVVVTNPGGPSTTFSEGFTIEKGHAAQVWVDILGRPVVRAGTPSLFYFYLGNRGNVDAAGVPFWIEITADSTWEFGFEITPPPLLAGEEPIDWSEEPIHVATEEGILIPLYIPVVPPGSIRILEMFLTASTVEEFQLRTWMNSPFFYNSYDENASASYDERISASDNEGFNEFYDDRVSTCVIEAAKLAWGDTTIPVTCYKVSFPDRLQEARKQGNDVKSLRQILAPEVSAMASCAAQQGITLTVPHGEVLDAMIRLLKNVKATQDLKKKCPPEGFIPDPPPPPEQPLPPPFERQPDNPPRQRDVISHASGDPNEKAGSQGVGEAQYLSGEEPLRYVIFFENLETATAPAREILITDPLDPATVDLATISLGPIAFGDREVVPPVGLSEFATDVDLRPDQDLIVRLQARLDTGSGVLSWHFNSIDPETGAPPEDPLAGFLPPNVNPPEGEGNVVFTLMPKQGLATGTEIHNRASIVFDANPPIDTPEWLNTLDDSKPASQVLPLASVQDATSFVVAWSGTDTGSGIKDYSVFVSEQAGPFEEWLRNTTQTSAAFSGTRGKSYSFYSIGRDHTDNREDALGSGDAQTFVSAEARPAADVDANGQADALTDGILIIRYLFGFRGDTLCDGAMAPGGIHTCEDAETYLEELLAIFDVDGNSNTDALTDGILMIRYLFGFRGDVLCDGAVAADATRDCPEIEAYIEDRML